MKFQMKATLVGAAAAVALASAPATAIARDTISIVGSSTVYPFATTVAERFGRSGNPTPRASAPRTRTSPTRPAG